MTTFFASETTPATFALEPSGTMRALPGGPPASIIQAVADFGVVSDDSPGVLTKTTTNILTATPTTRPAEEVDQSSGGFDWFDAFHVIPRSFDFGNVLSDQSIGIEVYCAFRILPQQEWTSFVNNAGSGTELNTLPTLPTDMGPMEGITMTVDVSSDGVAFVDATLDFAFAAQDTIFVPILIQRIVLWGQVGELPLEEELEFLTSVQESKDGTEKRAKLRQHPRQAWNYKFIIEEGTDAQTLENLLFDHQALNFGVPVFSEDTVVASAVTADDTTITVGSTAYRDFREGGFAVILTDLETFDVLQIETSGITSTTLTFTSGTVNAYAVGTPVYPLSVARTTQTIAGARRVFGLRREEIRFIATDNDVDLADLTPFSSYNDKLLLDSGNVVPSGSVSHGYKMLLQIIDGKVGLVNQSTSWSRHKRGHSFTMRAEGRQAIWEMRGLLHSIAGRLTSFYAPVDADSLVVVVDLVNGSATMDVTNVGFTEFVRSRIPKADLRVSFVDGSTALLRGISSSTSPTTTVDRLTLDATWPANIAIDEISRVEFVEKLRFDTDRFIIRYSLDGKTARVTAPLVAVFE